MYDSEMFYSIGPRGLYYKTLRTRNLQKMVRFHNKLVSFPLPVSKYNSLDKHASLLQNL